MEISKTNFFNGEYLYYYIDKDFYLKLKNIFKFENFNLYKKINNNFQLCNLIFNQYYFIPIGLFSNKNFILNCKWNNCDRKFIHKLNKNITCDINLFDYQEEIINEFEDNRKEITNINKAPCYINLIGNCSIGKTIITIYIIYNLGYKTFIITPTIELGKQWEKEIKKFLQNVNCFVSLNGVQKFLNNKDIESYDVLIIPYKHLNNDNFNKYLLDNFTVGVIDEQHTYNLETNSILKKFLSFNSFSVMLSLTATPRFNNSFYLGREINLEKIIEKYNIFDFEKKCYEIIIKNNSNLLNFKNSANYNKYISLTENKKKLSKDDILLHSIIKKRAISEDENRIHYIINNITETFFNNKNILEPKILILTKFINEIDTYYNRLILKDKNLKNNIFKIYAKKNKENVLETFSNLKPYLKKINKYIIIGTEDQLGTGIDLQDLNILHLTSITSNVNNLIQYAGRICRKNNSKIHELYFYNINSLDKISINKNIEIMRETLKKNNWMCFLKSI